MSIVQLIKRELEDCISFLRKNGFSHRENYSYISGNDLFPPGGNPGFLKFSDIKSYQRIYNQIISQNQFNILLFDGAIISFSYSISNNIINKMRCIYLPNPRIISQELFQDLEEDEIDLLANTENSLFCIPLRFDYKRPDGNPDSEEEPISHIHLSFMKNCHLPVSKPLTPKLVLLFILKYLYPIKYQEVKNESFFIFEGKYSFLTDLIRAEDVHGFYVNIKL